MDGCGVNILHISEWDNQGGSGRAAYRIHAGLRARGHGSRMFVGHRSTGDPDVALVADGWRRDLDRAPAWLCDKLGLQYLAHLSSFLLPWREWFRQADIVQLYNLHGGYFSYTALPWITRKKPAVWRLSDMWPFTGHCAYSYDCERWKTGCGRCPILADYPALPFDTTALLWRIKRRLYAGARLTVVAPSTWMARLARESPLLGHFPIETIPNGLDTSVFRPVPKALAREAMGLPSEARVLLFMAPSLDDRRRGGPVLREALGRLDSKARDWKLILAGSGGSAWKKALPVSLTELGSLRDDRSLSLAYAAADVFVFPTAADNLPNAVIESMACGTPVVSFDVGGVADVVRHMETGYLARPADAADLAVGIERFMADPSLAHRLGEQARRRVEAEHTLDLQAQRFEALYHRLLEPAQA